MSNQVTCIQHWDSLPDLDTEQSQHQELMQTDKQKIYTWLARPELKKQYLLKRTAGLQDFSHRKRHQLEGREMAKNEWSKQN